MEDNAVAIQPPDLSRDIRFELAEKVKQLKPTFTNDMKLRFAQQVGYSIHQIERYLRGAYLPSVEMSYTILEFYEANK
jgi:hypothetical protein